MKVPASVRKLWAPPPSLKPSEWAALYRRLPESSAARGSLWRNDTQPALAGIVDATVEPGVREVAVMKSAQAGVSESIANLLGFLIHLRPCPVLLVHPTTTSVEEFAKETFDDLVRSTPEVLERVRDRRAPRGTHQAESTILLKRFPGGSLALVGGNSPNAYSRRSVRVVIADDCARLPPAIGEEGDPASLLRARTATWPDRLCIFVSTPTIEGDVVDRAWSRSDQRRFHLQCPACGRWHFVTWNDPAHFRVSYEGTDPTTARLECPCGAQHDERARRAMVGAGQWIATRTPDEPGLAGFHLPRTVSLLGDATLPNLVGGWLAARRDGREALRTFANTVLGETWADRDSPRIEPHVLLARREAYPSEVPALASVITAGVDVQADRLELQVVAWGEHLERWVIDWTPIPGDPRRAETWELLLDVLGGTYEHANGRRLPIHATCIDSGFLADEVYAFVLANQHRRIFATKGESHATAEPLVMRASDRTFGRNARPVRLYRLNVDAGKAELASALSLPTGGPGTVHFGPFLGEDYFVQLTSERRERFVSHGVARERWTKAEGSRNEAWDTAIYARAAFDIVSAGRHDALVRKIRGEMNGNR